MAVKTVREDNKKKEANDGNAYPLLDRIDTPADLRKMPERDMPRLCREIRRFLVKKVRNTGGHLASNLGVVELSVALHRVFDTPHDHIVWDVSHQCYVHKMLTGRRDRFDTLRRPGGLSGFARRDESPYDCFGAGHSSTSISAALGIAEADGLAGKSSYTVAVVGDGAFTGGMIHEALNNCANFRGKGLIIILNENEMSISRNIGGLAKYLAKIRTGKGYHNAKACTRKMLYSLPVVGEPLYKGVLRVKKTFKDLIYSSNYFEELGLYYIGPVDGNDYEVTERVLRMAKEQGQSVIVHLKTRKGKGYAPAEADPRNYHSLSKTRERQRTFHGVFGETLTKMAEKDERICAVTAAMGVGTGLVPFAATHPERYFDVGIAEEHALTFCAGLATEGYRPYFAVYSTFLQRGYDNIIHDIALQRLPMHICIDRAGLAFADGATHHGIFDVAFLSHIPETEIWAPATCDSLKRILRQTKNAPKTVAVRYPNAEDNADIVAAFPPQRTYHPVRRWLAGDGEAEVLFVSYGRITAEAIAACRTLRKKGIVAGVILLEQLKPYDLLAERVERLVPATCLSIVFLEEGVYDGGAGMLLREYLALTKRGRALLSRVDYRILAIKDSFAVPEEETDYYTYCGISARAACDAARASLGTARATRTNKTFSEEQRTEK